jgi:hypothetical protein
MDTIPKLFKGIDGSSAGSFLALQWVKGYPVTSGAKTGDPWISNSDFAEWLSNNDKKGDNWK